jgi:hypothetical protein
MNRKNELMLLLATVASISCSSSGKMVTRDIDPRERMAQIEYRAFGNYPQILEPVAFETIHTLKNLERKVLREYHNLKLQYIQSLPYSTLKADVYDDMNNANARALIYFDLNMDGTYNIGKDYFLFELPVKMALALAKKYSFPIGLH